MVKQLFFILTLLLLISRCGNPLQSENEQLKMKIDSLEQTVEANEYIIGLMEVVGQYMDSIDASRKWVRLNLVEGLTEEDYVARMRNLNLYVQKAEWTIGELEKTRQAYVSQVRRLKEEVGKQNEEISRLQISVDQFRNKARKFEGKLAITQNQLMEVEASLDFNKKELESASSEIEGLMEKMVLTEAEIFYVQGEGMEEVAKKIRLAPKRKRKSLEEALQAYRTSFEMGYAPAEERIEILEKKLRKD